MTYQEKCGLGVDSMAQEMNETFEFGPFQADTVRRLLLRDGQAVPLTSKAFDTLVVLVRNRDRVMDKEELLKAIWPNSFVEEANLAQNVSALRKALGDQPGEHRYIATIPGRGYRFVGAVRLPFDPETEIVVASRTTAQVVIEEEVVEEASPVNRESQRRVVQFAALGLALAGALGGIYLWNRSKLTAIEAGTVKSLAVLPFQQLTPVPGDEYLGLGLSDAIITRLSNIRQLVIRPTSAVLKYSGPVADAGVPGRELRVDAILDGKVQKSGDHVRVTVQLIRVADGRPLWAETFDENFTGIFAVEDSVSAKVAQVLAVRLAGPEKQQLARHYTENVEAYRNYLQGRYAGFRFTPQGLNEAIAYFNRAIALDSSYALAYAGLADAYTTASDWVLPPRQALPKAEAAARKALAFDINLAEAHGSLAHALLHQWKLGPSGSEFQKALALNPNNTAFYFAYAEYLSALGKEDEAFGELKRALEIDPLSTDITSMMGWPLYLKGDYTGSIDVARKTIAIDAEFWVPYMGLGFAQLSLGQFPQAIEAFEKARALNPASTLVVAGLGSAWARSGRRDKAVQILATLEKMQEQQYVSPMDIATVHAALGEKDKAFEWLEKAFADQSEMLLFLPLHPAFEILRPDPRFQDLVRRVGVTR